MKLKRRQRGPLWVASWAAHEWHVLTLSLVVAVAAAVFGAAVNFNDYIVAIFRPYGTLPTVNFITNFLVVWLTMLLLISYFCWRRAAIRSEELEDIVDSISPDVLLVVDRDRQILMANASVTRMFGYGVEEVISYKTETLYFDRRNIAGARHEIYDALEREGFHIGLAVGRRKDGKTFPLEIITGLLRQHGGSVLVLRDMTERKEAEELLVERETQLRQSQKMEALGLLAGGVAHDFNNLLTSILGFSHLAYEALPEGHAARADLQEVTAAAERAAKLTAQLLAMGRKQVLQISPLNLNEVVGGMVLLLKRTLGEDIRLEIKMGEDAGFVDADMGGLEQVILNLAVNARDAMPQGGILNIETSRVALDDAYCRTHIGVEPGTYGRLVVRDTGCGMPTHVREHIFEPFFTTKEKGKGTGLGMSTVYGIVRQCQGYIEVNSTPGEGSEFLLFFRGTSGVAEPSGAREKPAIPLGTETILVVEDDDSARSYAVRILRAFGYNILEASSAKVALRLCQEHADPLDLILTDVVLPEVSGVALVEAARKVRQGFQVIYMTGYDEKLNLQHGINLTTDTVIMKPYRQEELAVKVRKALDAREQTIG